MHAWQTLQQPDKETTLEYLQVMYSCKYSSAKTSIVSFTPQRMQKLVVDSFHSHLVLSSQSDFLLRVRLKYEDCCLHQGTSHCHNDHQSSQTTIMLVSYIHSQQVKTYWYMFFVASKQFVGQTRSYTSHCLDKKQPIIILFSS